MSTSNCPALRITNLGKKYIIRHQNEPGYGTLRDAIVGSATSLLNQLRSKQKTSSSCKGFEEFWALRDMTAEINRGDAIGIIGRNGAGKSTFLKLLSRITAPTTGRIEYYGQVASLLEVGTGFHPELSGRENIYLNGSILGMSRDEISRKFNEIVAFAEVEKFLDTPVKRYSSGMYVRLAFAVAAHLDPDILVVDEVLAVGDAAFQRKCLGKMRDVAGQNGRTVLFVSHNMQAVQSLCEKAIYLDAGRMLAFADSKSVVSRYLSDLSSTGCLKQWPLNERPGNHEIRLIAVQVLSDDDASGTYSTKKPIYVEIEFEALEQPSALSLGFDLVNSEGVTAFRSYQNDGSPEDWPPIIPGVNRWRCTIPPGTLNAGIYYISPRISIHNTYWIVNLDAAVQFEAILDHGISPFWNSLTAGSRPGLTAPIFSWQTVPAISPSQPGSSVTQ